MKNFICRITAAVLAVVMISGCAAAEKPKTESQTEPPRSEQKEKSITLGVVELDTYNPLATESVTMRNMLGFIFEPLFYVDSEQNTKGILAHSYKTAPDGKSITVNLKRNVLWHDGTEFSSKDVVYTIQMLLNGTSRYSRYLENVSSVYSQDGNTVCVTFEKSVPEPASLLSFPIIKNGSWSADFKPVGTGPFYLDYDRLTSFEAYHGEKAKIDSVKIKSVPDNDKFVSLFNASVTDVADSEMLDMNEYTPRSNATVNEYVTGKMVFMGFNAQDDVFKYPEARRAVYELADRKNTVSHIYFSRAVAAHYPINPKSRFYPESAENMHSDRGAAEKELKSEKWKKDSNGVYYRVDEKGMTYFNIEILVNSDNAERIKIAAELSETMTDFGIKNSVTACGGSEFDARLRAGNYDMFVGETELLPNNDISEIISDRNILGYSDAETDILMSQIGTLIAENDKKSVYTLLFERIREECPIAPICFLKESMITSAKIKTAENPSVSGTVICTEKWSVQ